MVQQLNLYESRLRRQRSWSLDHTLLVLAGVALLCLLGGLGLRYATQAAQAELARTELLLGEQRGRLQAGQNPALAALNEEVQRLRSLDAAQQRLHGLIDSGLAGQRQGHAGYLLALAHQSHPAVWLTGLKISADGSELELRGRMLDAEALPDYLRRLNAEPLLRGRQFGQLQLQRAEGPEHSDGGYSEFTLRSRASGSAADTPATRPAPARRTP